MGNRRTSICIDKGRLISSTKTGLVLWLTTRNIHKFKERLWLYIFIGKSEEGYTNYGSFKIDKKLDGIETGRGNMFYKFKLKRMKEIKYEGI